METFSALLAIFAGNTPASGEFPAQRLMTRSFVVFFDLCLNKWLRKQSWGRWFETLSRPLWRYCNELFEPWGMTPRGSFSYLIRRLIVRFRKSERPRDICQKYLIALRLWGFSTAAEVSVNYRNNSSISQIPMCISVSSSDEKIQNMMTSSNGTIFALLDLCAVSGEFPAQRPVTRSFDVFFDLCVNKRLSKQSWGWWFETPSRSLWSHRNDTSSRHYLATWSTVTSSEQMRDWPVHVSHVSVQPITGWPKNEVVQWLFTYSTKVTRHGNLLLPRKELILYTKKVHHNCTKIGFKVVWWFIIDNLITMLR